ncbi:MAG: magnesium/cobalt transporter CorA [Planctomycetes bacterium]|nr:magnesium/cobalt transporter CorA [Planctomycetota bacterium]
MRKLIRNQSTKRGLPPGTPVFIGERRAEPPRITLIDYDEAEVLERRVDGVEACLPFRHTPTTTWINVDGLQDVEMVQALCEGFAVHPLVQEDILNTGQRPKCDEYDQYLYIVVKMLRWDRTRGEVDAEQVSLILGRNVVLSFQERPGDVFDPVRQRLRSGKGRVRKHGADYLAYCLLDAVVDGYFEVLEHIGDTIENIEDELVNHSSPATLRTIHRLKRESLMLHRNVWPLREVVQGLDRSDSALVAKATHPYLRDVLDHAVKVVDTVATFRDMLTGMLDIYLSSLSNRTNDVMKVLTIIATIFIPLTFIAGVYGMNFHHMPELQWRWAYPAVLALMAAIAAAMLVYFRRKRWI